MVLKLLISVLLGLEQIEVSTKILMKSYITFARVFYCLIGMNNNIKENMSVNFSFFYKFSDFIFLYVFNNHAEKGLISNRFLLGGYLKSWAYNGGRIATNSS